MKRFSLCIALLAAAFALPAHGMTFPLNTIRFYDLRYWTYNPDVKFDCGTYFFDYYHFGARNPQGQKVNPLQVWTPQQNSLAMLKGFKSDTEIGQLASKLNQVNDNGTRGHWTVTGDLNIKEAGIGLRWHLPHGVLISAYLPVFDMQLSNVAWTNLSQKEIMPDYLLAQYLTDDFFANVRELGGLDLNTGWHRKGVGDLLVLLQWMRNFEQRNKPALHNVLLNVRLGSVFPTGKRASVEDLFSIPFGYDGAFGLAFGGGLELRWYNYLAGGIDTDFRYLFPATGNRRIMTDPTQTDLLMLATSESRIDQGFVQRFNLYTGIHDFLPKFYFDLGYQYQKQGESRITLFNDAIEDFYVSSYANAAQSLQEWTLHQIWISLKYTYDRGPGALSPTFMFMWANTFKAHQGLTNRQAGLSLSFSF